MITTKKTNPFCPIVHEPCLGASCALYNDDARGCVLNAQSLHLIVRTAISDAAVEISRHMGDDLK